MKRWRSFLFFTLCVTAASSALFAAEPSLKIVNVAVPAVSLLQAPLFVAIDAGIFKKYGVEVDGTAETFAERILSSANLDELRR